MKQIRTSLFVGLALSLSGLCFAQQSAPSGKEKFKHHGRIDSVYLKAEL